MPPPAVREEARGPVVGIDVDNYTVTKVVAMQCHASQHPPYPGRPEKEASKLVCHEYFTLALPAMEEGSYSDLFAPVAQAKSGSRVV